MYIPTSFLSANTSGVEIGLLIVAGGGGRGNGSYGGGGAGGMVDRSGSLDFGTYNVIVGAAGGVEQSGGNSSFGSITAIGGGRGATQNANGSAADGGSGGGAAPTSGGGTAFGNGLQPSSIWGGFGNNGSLISAGSADGCGGGAGGAPVNPIGPELTRAGVGRVSALDGVLYCVGGAGINGVNSPGAASAYGSGGGSAGGARPGIVKIKYAGPQTATGGVVTESDGYVTHTFESNGTFIDDRCS
jgi:hypothetical protein